MANTVDWVESLEKKKYCRYYLPTDTKTIKECILDKTKWWNMIENEKIYIFEKRTNLMTNFDKSQKLTC